MTSRIAHAELLGVTASSLTVSFQVQDASGEPVPENARVLIDGEVRADVDSETPTRLVRIEHLDAATPYRIEIETAEGRPGAHDDFFPETATTLPAPGAREVASIATLNDVHFGEQKIGGVLTADKEYGDAAPGFPVIRAGDTETPYPRFMNADAVSQINDLAVDAAVIKGDIADRGLPEQFEEARKCFAGFTAPHHALLGNHDYLGQRDGKPEDGYALLGQDPAPRRVEIGGWHLLLVETALPGEHYGVMDAERLAWLDDALSTSDAENAPSLVVMHHQPVPPAHRDGYPNSIGLLPEDSVRLFAITRRHPSLRAVLIGHTHRNRVRRYAEAGDAPFAETSNSKDYPGSFTHYRLFEDGSFHQEVRRIATPRALAHSTRCRDLFQGLYRNFTLGSLADRCFAVGPMP